MKHALYELHIRPQNGDYSAVLGRRMAASPPFFATQFTLSLT